MKSVHSLLRGLRLSPLSFALVALVGCNPMNTFYKEVKSYGYIPYETPLQYAGPGTLVGGAPNRMSLIAPPQTCFPSEVDGVPTKLYQIDNSSIAKKSVRLSFGGEAKVSFLDLMNVGNPVIGAGVKLGTVYGIEVEMKGVHVEYMDSIMLYYYYLNLMPQICKDYLAHVGVIIQALKVEEMSIRLFSKSGATIFLDLEKISQYFDIHADVDFQIEYNSVLTITTPKYIGYQLGRLKPKDGGVALYRSTYTRFNKYVFRSLDIFGKGPFGLERPTVAKQKEQQMDELLGDYWSGLSVESDESDFTCAGDCDEFAIDQYSEME